MMTGNNRHRAASYLFLAAAAALVLLAGAVPGLAQTAEGQPKDLKFEIINATTGEHGTVDRMTIEYVTARRNGVADFAPEGSSFTAGGVPIIEGGKYIVTVMRDGVPYWWSKRGRELEAGTVVLHVFDTVSSLEGVYYSGLNLVVRRQESLLRLEYMLNIVNEAKPQVTVMGSPATFELALPEGASEIEASYTRGPDPTPVTVRAQGTHSGLSVPLTPGQNLIRLQAVVPWTDGMEIPVGSQIPVRTWSVLASPEWLVVGSTDLEENDSEQVAGFTRFTGFPLEGDEIVRLRLNAGEQAAGPQEDLFTQEAPADQEAAVPSAKDAKGGGMSLPLIFLGVLVILIIVAAIRRRS